MLKLYKKITIRYRNEKETDWEDERCKAEIINNTLHIVDALGDELIVMLDSVQTIRLETYKAIPKEIGE